MDADTVIRTLAVLLFVLGLIGAAAWLGKRFGLTPRATARPGDGKRLSVVEVLTVDAKRRLLLVRRDDTEHLILLGGDSETVVETAIRPPEDPAP